MAEQSKFEYEVYLSLRGKLDVDEFTNAINIKPTYSLKKGEAGLYTRNSSTNIWNYSLGRTYSYDPPDLCAQLQKLISVLKGKEECLIKKMQSPDIFGVIQIYLSVSEDIDFSDTSFPALTLNKEIIQFASKIGLEIDIDVDL